MLAALLLSGAAVAQHEGHGKAPDAAKDTAKTSARIGDAYPFDVCPISGKKLGTMGVSTAVSFRLILAV